MHESQPFVEVRLTLKLLLKFTPYSTAGEAAGGGAPGRGIWRAHSAGPLQPRERWRALDK
jgi:hypothetical protein